MELPWATCGPITPAAQEHRAFELVSVVVASRRVKQGYCSAVILETGILQRLEHNSLHDLPLAREHAGGAGKY